MTARETIEKYLSTRKNPASAKEIAQFAKLNPNTVRRVLGDMVAWAEVQASSVKCKIDKAMRTGYSLA